MLKQVLEEPKLAFNTLLLENLLFHVVLVNLKHASNRSKTMCSSTHSKFVHEQRLYLLDMSEKYGLEASCSGKEKGVTQEAVELVDGPGAHILQDIKP